MTAAWKTADVTEIPITPPADRNKYDMDVMVAISDAAIVDNMAMSVVVIRIPKEAPSRIVVMKTNHNGVVAVQNEYPVVATTKVKAAVIVMPLYSPVREIKKPENTDPHDNDTIRGIRYKPARVGLFPRTACK